jgi:hypothetical protein
LPPLKVGSLIRQEGSKSKEKIDSPPAGTTLPATPSLALAGGYGEEGREAITPAGVPIFTVLNGE